MATNIDYIVRDSRKYIGKKRDDISKINQKSRVFTFQSKEKEFIIEIGFKKLATVEKIEIKVKDVDQILFEFMTDTSKQPLMVKLSPQQRDQQPFIKNVGEGIFANRVIITLINTESPKNSSIFYILFKGIVFPDKNSKSPKVTNVEDLDNYKASTKKTVGMSDREIFNFRQKQKSSPEDLVNEVTGRHVINLESDMELQQALRKSKQQFKRQEREQENFIDNRKDEEEFDDEPSYNVIEYTSKVREVYSHVSDKWLQAQLRAQQGLGVRKKHSVTNVIKVKSLYGMNFCLNIRDHAAKSALKAQIESMGGHLSDEPCNGCYLITKSIEGARINLAKSMTGIKYLSPDYITDCSKQKRKLPEDKYRVATL